MSKQANFVIPREGQSFLHSLRALESSGEDVYEAFASGRMSYVGGGAEIFPVEGLDRIINLSVRNTGSLNRNSIESLTITDATNATPIAVTSTAHGLGTGDRVRIAAVTGNTSANGVWTITRTGANTFTLDNSIGNGTYGGSPTCVVLAAPVQTQYLGLFTSQSATTVPARATTLTGLGTGTFVGPTNADVVEATGGGYTRAAIQGVYTGTSGDWPAAVDESTSGRKSVVVAPGVSFAQSSGSQGTIMGFFLATTSASTAQYTGVAIFYANFDDGNSIAVNAAGYTVRIAPYIRFDH